MHYDNGDPKKHSSILPAALGEVHNLKTLLFYFLTGNFSMRVHGFQKLYMLFPHFWPAIDDNFINKLKYCVILKII